MYALGLVHSVDNILFTTNCREAVTQRQDAKRRLPPHRGARRATPGCALFAAPPGRGGDGGADPLASPSARGVLPPGGTTSPAFGTSDVRGARAHAHVPENSPTSISASRTSFVFARRLRGRRGTFRYTTNGCSHDHCRAEKNAGGRTSENRPLTGGGIAECHARWPRPAGRLNRTCSSVFATMSGRGYILSANRGRGQGRPRQSPLASEVLVQSSPSPDEDPFGLRRGRPRNTTDIGCSRGSLRGREAVWSGAPGIRPGRTGRRGRRPGDGRSVSSGARLLW